MDGHRHKRSCWRKIRHRSEFVALAMLHETEKRKTYDGRPLKVYECSACHGWHVGHAEKPSKQKGIKP